jgi:hypothetical protein
VIPPALIRFGSFHGRLHSTRQEYTDALALVFGVALHPLTSELDDTRQFDLAVTELPDLQPVPDAAGVQVNRLTLGGSSERPVISTEVLQAELQLDQQPIAIQLTVLRSDLTFPALCVHFGVIIHKVLFQCNRLMLHAGAVQLDDAVSLFVGDKGAGKSTSCLALAHAGGTVLGEDQVTLLRSDGHFLVSGNDERSRVTDRTERHFFQEALPIVPRDFAGTMKKEIAMRDYFKSEPFRDFTPHRLIFPKVTGTFALTRLSSQAALRRMMGYNGHFQRFAGVQDQAEFLDFLAAFVGSISCWELTLSHDLRDLDSLPGRLRDA